MFTGCPASHDYKTYVFDPAIVAKKVCINPLTDVDGVVALRFELYGCELDTGAEDSGTVDVITGALDASILARDLVLGRLHKFFLSWLDGNTLALYFCNNIGDGFDALGVESGHIQDFQMSASYYYVDGTTYYPPWRARMGLYPSFVTDAVEGSYLQLYDDGSWLQVNHRTTIDMSTFC